jgi:hypothetical protein
LMFMFVLFLIYCAFITFFKSEFTAETDFTQFLLIFFILNIWILMWAALSFICANVKLFLILALNKYFHLLALTIIWLNTFYLIILFVCIILISLLLTFQN